MSELTFLLLVVGVKLALVFGVVLTLAAYLTLAERVLLGRMQRRYGPNRTGYLGLLQPLADLIKLLAKEDTVPPHADRPIFKIAPGLTAAAALLVFAVVPFGPPLTLFGRQIPLGIADLNIGVLYFLSLSSIGVYGVALGGWASNSKYALLGGIRGLAQMISYELAMGLAIVPVVMAAQSFSLSEIVRAQQSLPFALTQPLAALIFLVSALAESKRTPFDQSEADSELAAGYHTEYSGMRFGLFFVGEYINLLVLGAMTTVFFLGGWHGPLLPPVFWFTLKVLAVAFLFIWVRGSHPRLRYDQLMHFGWKILVPLALANIIVTGAVLLWWRG